jgi:hypothetical protein
MERPSRIWLAFNGRGRKRKLSLYWHLRNNFDAYQAAHEASGKSRYDWIAISEELSASGFRSKDGSPLKPGTVRQTWLRVRFDLAAEAAKPRRAPPVVAEPGERVPLSEVVIDAKDYVAPAPEPEPAPPLLPRIILSKPEPVPEPSAGRYWSRLVGGSGGR